MRSYRWPLCYPLQSPTLLVFPQDQEHQRGHQTCPCSARHHVRPSASHRWGEPGLSPPLPKLSQSLFPLSLQRSSKTSVCNKPVLLCETSEPWRQPQTSPPNPGSAPLWKPRPNCPRGPAASSRELKWLYLECHLHYHSLPVSLGCSSDRGFCCPKILRKSSRVFFPRSLDCSVKVWNFDFLIYFFVLWCHGATT